MGIFNEENVLFLLVPRHEEKISPPLAWCASIYTVSNVPVYTGLNTEKYTETANAFINRGRCQPQKFVTNARNDISGAFIIAANVEKQLYGFIT